MFSSPYPFLTIDAEEMLTNAKHIMLFIANEVACTKGDDDVLELAVVLFPSDVFMILT